jgi:hypothetical protein
MVLAGRASEVPEERVRSNSHTLMALGRLDEALVVGEEQPRFAMWPRLLAGLRATIAGDRPAAERWFACPPARRFTQLRIEPARTVIVPFLRELMGDADAVAREARATIAERRWLEKQRPYHLARYLLGEIDDAGFRAQPYRLRVEADLALVRAVRAERERRPADAVAAYRAWSALPRWARAYCFDPVSEEFVAWRLRVLGDRR